MPQPCFAEMLEESFGTPQTAITSPCGTLYIRASWPLVLRRIRMLAAEHDGLLVVQRDGNKPIRFIKDGEKLHRSTRELSPIEVLVGGLTQRA